MRIFLDRPNGQVCRQLSACHELVQYRCRQVICKNFDGWLAFVKVRAAESHICG